MKDLDQSLFIPFSLILRKNCKLLQIKGYWNFNGKILNHKTRIKGKLIFVKLQQYLS